MIQASPRSDPPRTGYLLAAYGLAWKSALPVISALARLDGAVRGALGRGCLPRNWRVTERLRIPTVAAGGPETLWCHCASLGEAKGLWGLVRELMLDQSPLADPFPFRIHLTANTAAGLDFLRRECEAFGISAEASAGVPGIGTGMAPFDHPGLVRRFLIALNVKAICIFETELWPNYIRVGTDLGIPVSLVSARLTSKALALYRRYPRAAEAVIGRLAWIQAQSDLDRDRFRSFSQAPITTGFDFKAAHYLRAGYFRGSGASSAEGNAAGIGRSRIALISLHVPELRLLLPELPALSDRFPIVVFPRHMRDLPAFRRLLEPLGFVLHSRDAQARNQLVDSMGQVGAILPSCHSALVGGSLIPSGCHNLWEPLLNGLKTYFGPEYGNQENLARLLLEWGIAEVVSDIRTLREWRVPGPEVMDACGLLWNAQNHGLAGAIAECRGRIFATFTNERRNAAVATQMRGKEK